MERDEREPQEEIDEEQMGEDENKEDGASPSTVKKKMNKIKADREQEEADELSAQRLLEQQ